jgi:hypothetical protein
LEITPPLDIARPTPPRQSSGPSNVSAPSASSTFAPLDKALAKLQAVNDNLESLVTQLEMVRLEMLVAASVDYRAHEALKVKKKGIKDKVKVMERQADICIGVIECLTEVDGTAE